MPDRGSDSIPLVNAFDQLREAVTPASSAIANWSAGAASWVTHMDANDVMAVATVATALVAGLSAEFARRQVRQARELREDQARE